MTRRANTTFTDSPASRPVDSVLCHGWRGGRLQPTACAISTFTFSNICGHLSRVNYRVHKTNATALQPMSLPIRCCRLPSGHGLAPPLASYMRVGGYKISRPHGSNYVVSLFEKGDLPASAPRPMQKPRHRRVNACLSGLTARVTLCPQSWRRNFSMFPKSAA